MPTAKPNNPSILFFAAEHSGDKLGAELLPLIQQQLPQSQFSALGGPLLKEAGADIFLNNDALDIIGFSDVFKKLPTLWRLWQRIKQYILQTKPDLIILIDSPGLNLRIAKFAHKHGIKVLYYVSPQIWAWKAKRLQHIKKYVDHMALLFPFEKEMYDQAQVPSTIVGHPMLQRFQQHLSSIKAKHLIDVENHDTVLAVLPGSRYSEVSRLMPVILEAARLIHQQLPELQMNIAQADSIKSLSIPQNMQHYVSIKKGMTDEVVAASDAVICASGTATLEVALANKPMVIIYKLSNINYQIAKRLIKLPYVGLCNIVLGKGVMTELIQEDCTAKNLSNEAIALLTNQDKRDQILDELAQLKAKLGYEHDPNKLVNVIKQLIDT